MNAFEVVFLAEQCGWKVQLSDKF